MAAEASTTGLLRIRELYRSIQGESTFAGWPCVFVRTAGCDIRCVYCDEPHAFTGGERLSVERSRVDIVTHHAGPPERTQLRIE